MKLIQLIQGLEISKSSGDLETSISGVSYDSRSVKDGDLFVTWKGIRNDGLHFVDEALSRGASAFCVEDESAHFGQTPWLLVKDARVFLGSVAKVFYRHPSQDLKVVGVTGTNGKTTVSFLVEKIFQDAGLKPGLLGTIHYKMAGRVIPSHRTTPESLDVQRFLREMLDMGCKSAVMEVSSHALDQGRVRDVDFDAALFTNLTQDHLDYHKDLESYFQAKSSLFKNLRSDAFAVLNTDDPFGERLFKMIQGHQWSYGLSEKSMVRAQNIHLDSRQSGFEIMFPGGKIDLNVKLIGLFNVYNVLASFALGCAMGVDPEGMKQSLENFDGVPGRMEFINIEAPFQVVVDYAHTEDALKNVLGALRPLVKGRLVVVFGCGGDRDRDKRSKMGKVVAQNSDFFIVTSDNPRNEDPQEIAREIEEGFKLEKTLHRKILDRKSAIEFALVQAGPGDLILIAGKGHEKFQEIGLSKFPFDDGVVVREIFSRVVA